MHRIDRVVDEIEATLRGRGPESDELRAECLGRARDMIAEYENAGLKTSRAVRKTARLLPRKILPRYGIKPINETLWFHLAILASLAGLYLVDRFLVKGVWDSYLGVIEYSVSSYLFFWFVCMPEYQMWIGRVGHEDFSYLLRKVRFEDVARVFYSLVGGVTVELRTGKRVRLGAVRSYKYHLLQRVLDGMGPDVEVDQRAKELVAKAGQKLSIPSQDFWRKVIAVIGALFSAYLVALLVILLWLRPYPPFDLELLPVAAIPFLAIIIGYRIKLRHYLQYFLAVFAFSVSITYSFFYVFVFSDDLLLSWLLLIGSAFFLFISIRFMLRPHLGRAYAMAIICCAFFAPLLALAPKAVLEKEVETVEVFKGLFSAHEIYLADENLLVFGMMSTSSLDAIFVLYKADLSTGEAQTLFYNKKNIATVFHFVSPDRKLVMSTVEEWHDYFNRNDDSYSVVLTDLDSQDSTTVARENSGLANFSLKGFFDYWSPGAERFLYSTYDGSDSHYFYYDLEAREKKSIDFNRPRGSIDPFWMDEKRMVYLTRERLEHHLDNAPEYGGCSLGSVSFWTYDVETGDTEKVLVLDEPVDCSAARDIPGRTIVYAMKGGLLVIDLKTMTTIPIELDRENAAFQNLGKIAHRADKDTVILPFVSGKNYEEMEALGFGLIDLENRKLKFLPAEHPCPICDFEASPEKTKIAYTLCTNECPQYKYESIPPGELWLYDLDTGASRKILTMYRQPGIRDNIFVWSPDSKYIYAPTGIGGKSPLHNLSTRIVKVKVE